MKLSLIEQAAGPRMTMNSVGRMNRISGTVMIAGQPGGLFLGAHHALVAEFGRQHAQRRGERRAVFLGLDHGRDDAAHRFEVDAVGEVLERLAALVEEAQFDRGQAELVAELGIGLAELLGDAAEGGVDGEARLGADDQQVERVGKALADPRGCAC